MDRYITAAQAAQFERQALTSFRAPALDPIYRPGLVGTRRGDDYYVVPDDDPRLQGQTPDPRVQA